MSRGSIWMATILLGWLLAGAGVAQERNAKPAAKIDLSVLLVAGKAEGRRADYAAFLRKHFTEVATAVRETFDPKKAEGVDVVLLDWPQGDEARKMREAGKTPLGDFETWKTPTVLLGSAGLNVAHAWGVRGGFG